MRELQIKVLNILTFLCLIHLLIVSEISAQETITVIGWNSESGGADPDTVADRIEEIDGCDIWGMCEVKNSQWAAKFETGAEVDENADFKTVLGTTGGSDKMQIIYDSDKFDLINNYELHRLNIGGRVRAPLIAHFKLKSSGLEFLFMVNHLYRGNNRARHEQAALLNKWAGMQHLPIIAVGDYNFDWEVIGGGEDHDYGYDNMVANNNFYWIRPKKLKKTFTDNRYNSILDFIFLGGNVWNWKAKSQILARDKNDIHDNSVTDTDFQPDHRPVQAIFTIP